MSVRFAKMCGCGNDFMVIDNRGDVIGDDASAFARRHCERRFAVGADGVLLIEDSDAADFRLRIVNSDGSEAEMCGNGARCAASFAAERGIAPSRMQFETLGGVISAEVGAEQVSIGMGEVMRPGEPVDLSALERTWHVHPIEVGVPHAVIFVEDVEAVPVDRLGRAIREHDAFQPRGTNVDFVRVLGPDAIRIRTYERGVEAETMACGTGSIGSAIASYLRRSVGPPPVAVEVRGGVLQVDFLDCEDAFRDVLLTGDAVLAYEGEVPG